MSFQFETHTADAAIKVQAFSLPDLFKSALEGMNSILIEGFCEKASHYDCIRDIEVNASNRTNLLIDFLSDVLAQTYIYKAIFCNIYFSHFSESRISGQLFGTWFTHFDEEIKSVTYHEAEVIRDSKGQWEATIIFDI